MLIQLIASYILSILLRNCHWNCACNTGNLSARDALVVTSTLGAAARVSANSCVSRRGYCPTPQDMAGYIILNSLNTEALILLFLIELGYSLLRWATLPADQNECCFWARVVTNASFGKGWYPLLPAAIRQAPLKHPKISLPLSWLAKSFALYLNQARPLIRPSGLNHWWDQKLGAAEHTY